ncbi:MAG: hypothetical protein Kow0020_10390 [Wenzhouxiangellaceae bacterium]
MARSRIIEVFDIRGALTGRYGLDASGQLQSCPDSGAPDERVLLIPADRVAILAVDLPELRGPRLTEALRWAIEEQISGDPEAQHVVALGRRDDGRMRCAVIERGTLASWIERLPAAPTRIVPDAACLPVEAGSLSMMPSDDAVLFCAGPWDFDRVDRTLVADLLPAWLSRHPEIRELVWIGDDAPATLAGRSVQSRPAPADPVKLLTRGALETPVNLADGEFDAGADARRRRWGPWIAGLAVAALVLGLANAGVELWLLKQARDRADTAVRERLAVLFPEIQVVVNPKVQVERVLAELGGAAADRFVAAMRQVAAVLGGAPGVELEGLDFDGRIIEVVLVVPGVADLEALQRRAAAAGLAAAVRDLTVQGERTRAVLEFEGA